ncbi:poly-beta-1,6-N-acetyl-D-glucosamine biosynthesis protein PgaD [Dyella sp. OK004]|uniref:poly-beta-1,6-N-acetyl-D-glucosamine biosynthesis protein PgaD n=1 Tax=Dyella sp. OK004 TaxID=1855292 RepID=UPI0008E2A594|nr:poly-beta-1,6-N-acetyl-D-glucosamine biosynthesis protein PgaD [Dyella sp. OK004]SFS08875.1 poly-beta-1,6-N-acetyl-D-glucosamine biosynthesis protein PgaD [Dyella sp. OK004]
MRAEAILIQRPERQRPAQRLLFTTATLLAWAVWASLWLPLATLVAWLLGLRISYVEMVVREHDRGMNDLLTMLAIACACALAAAAWAGYNRLRYGHLRRRHRGLPADRTAIASALGVQHVTATWMYTAPHMVLEFLEDGLIVHQQGAQQRVLHSAAA